MDEDHLGAVFEDQVSDSTVGQCDAHQVLTLQSQNLHKSKDPSLTWSEKQSNGSEKSVKHRSNRERQDDCAINPVFIQALIWSVGQVQM